MENPFEIIEERLERIEKLLKSIYEVNANNKDNHSELKIMTIKEIANYLSLSVPTIYGYTAKRNIPHAKRGNRLYFKKLEIDQWILEGRQNTINDIERIANNYLANK